MKRALFAFSMMLMVGAMPASVGAQGPTVPPGQLVKASSSSAVYYIDEDLSRHVFPNPRVFASWYADFESVIEISGEELSEYPLAGNMPYKPGKRLVKLKTDPKTYAVDEGGVLRWVRSEAAARALYGENWNQLVDDLSDAFFIDYQVGDDIESDEEFETEQETDPLENLREKRLRKLEARGASAGALENRGFGRNKVAVCHNFDGDDAHTIFIARPALRAHLNHGDEEGRCAGDEEENEEGEEEDTAAPELLTASATGVAETSARIIFTTDEDVTAVIHSSTSTPVDTSATATAEVTALADSHDVELTGLESETTYHVVITVADEAGNETTSSELTFTTLAEDITAPTILSSSVDDITSDSATVNFTADEDVTAVVYIGTSSPVDTGTATSVDSAALADVHAADFTGLTAETEYHAVIVMTDEAGNETTSSELTFTTLADA